MLPSLLFQIITISADVVLFLFVGYYLVKLRHREQEVAKKEAKIDTDYHHVVDDALAKERKILDDATSEATDIIAGAKQLSTATKQSVDTALTSLAKSIEQQAQTTSTTITQAYQQYLKQIAATSLNDFQAVTKNLEKDMQSQMNEFHKSFLATLEKELEAYKNVRMQQTEVAINNIVQKASQEILNKSISLEDHEQLVIESLEKAKKAGVFN